MNPLELRKILLVGYAFDAPAGAPLLDRDGLPIAPRQHPIRMRFAFWIPQRAPFQRRGVGTTLDYLRSVVAAKRAAIVGAAATPLDDVATTAEEYAGRHGLHDHLLAISHQLEGYTLVAGAMPHELEALRAGAIVEQVQDFTFDRQPSMEELRRHLMPHWEQRTLASLGELPNAAPVDNDPKPTLLFEAI